MKTIDILAWIYRLQHLKGTESFWQGKLDKNAVDHGICIQFSDHSEKLFFGRTLPELPVYRKKSCLAASSTLHVQIRAGGKMAAHEDKGKAGRAPFYIARGGKLRNFRFDFIYNPIGAVFAVKK